MSLNPYFVICVFFMVLGAVSLYGLHSPKRFLFLSVASVSLINFSFFMGEVANRISLPDILFSILGIIFVLRISVGYRQALFLPRGPSFLLLFMFAAVLISLCTAPWNRAILFGEGATESLILGAVIFLLCTSLVDSEKDLHHFFKAWFISALIAAAITFIDMGDLFTASRVEKYDNEGYFGILDLFANTLIPHPFLSSYAFRLQGSFRSPGQLAAYSLTTAIVLLAYSRLPQVKKHIRFFLVSLVTCCAVFIFFTGRSSVILSLLVAIFLLACYALIRSRSLRPPSKRTLLILCAILTTIAIILLLVLAVNPDVFTSLVTRNYVDYRKLFTGKGFFHLHFQQALEAFKDHPLFGIGFGRFVYSDYHLDIRGYEIHSTPLQFLAETGLFGFLAYVTFMGYFLRISYLSLKRAWGTQWQDFYAILYLGFISMTFSYLYNRHLRERTFWMFIAIIYLVQKWAPWRKTIFLAGNDPDGITPRAPSKLSRQ